MLPFAEKTSLRMPKEQDRMNKKSTTMLELHLVFLKYHPYISKLFNIETRYRKKDTMAEQRTFELVLFRTMQKMRCQ